MTLDLLIRVEVIVIAIVEEVNFAEASLASY
jgi:hypothetical protein